MITSAIACFKKRRVYTLMKSCVPVSSIEVPLVEFSLPYFPVLPVEEEAIRFSIRAGLKEFKDVFSYLALSRVAFDFPSLEDEERRVMEVVG
jgi:hypothetical protein